MHRRRGKRSQCGLASQPACSPNFAPSPCEHIRHLFCTLDLASLLRTPHLVFLSCATHAFAARLALPSPLTSCSFPMATAVRSLAVPSSLHSFTALVLLCCLVLSGCCNHSAAQYFTTTPSTPVSYIGSSSASSGLFATVEPTCLTDYAAVWATSSAVEMWAISGAVDAINDESVVVQSTDGFATYTSAIPTYTTPNAILRKRRAGGAAKLVNGTRYYTTGAYSPIIMWGGNTESVNTGHTSLSHVDTLHQVIRSPDAAHVLTTLVSSDCVLAR